MSQILVVGSLGYDDISTPKGRVQSALGGSANYFSLAAASYAPVSIVGVVGSDYCNEDFQILKDRGVNLEGLKVADGLTFRWEGRYEGDMNEAITLKTELNVFQNFQPDLPAAVRKSPYVFLGNIDPELQMTVLDQVEDPRVVGLDTMNFWIDGKLGALTAALSRVDVLLLNETEAKKLSGEPNTMKAIDLLCKMGPKAIVVKRGEYGFILASEGHFFTLPAFPVRDVVDPTGAGDSFAGGFFGYLAAREGDLGWQTLREACMHGTVVASFSVQDFGVNELLKLDMGRVEGRLNQYADLVTFRP